MTLKRLIVSLCIVLIFCITFIGGYTRSADIVYADSTTDQWTQVTTNQQLVEAFRYYCKSRDLTIEGTFADGVTSFTTSAFNGLCNTLGIDITALQAHIKYQTDGNRGLRFLFDSTGISAYNRIFAQFLQDNELEVGDKVDDKNVYSGRMFTDFNGNTANVYVVDSMASYYGNIHPIIEHGSFYKYTSDDLISLYRNNNGVVVYNLTQSLTITKTVYYNSSAGNQTRNEWYSFFNGAPTNVTEASGLIYYFNGDTRQKIRFGNSAIFYNRTDGKYYFGFVLNILGYSNENPTVSAVYYTLTDEITTDKISSNFNVNLTTNNNVINNNNYEGDTIINNPDNNEDPDPDEPNYNPYPDGGGGTTPPTNTGGGSGEDDGTITFPDFDFHLPQINWSLGDLSEKFPFSIPFDLIAFFTVLNAEPQAPAIDADIPLGSWYTWHFEADFAQFDNYAVIIRNVEFIGFCVGLIYLTIKLVKG